MFFQNARQKGQNSFFDFLLTMIITVIFYVFSSLPFLLYTLWKGLDQSDLTRYLGPFPFALMLFVFSGILFGVIAGTKYIHGRPVLTVFTGASSFRWRHMFKGAMIWLVVLVILEIIGYMAEPELYTFQFDPIPFFLCLIVGILILPLQTTAEEVMVRGYLMQQIGLVTKYRWVPVLATSLFFGLLHAGNPEVIQYGLSKAMTVYIGMGLFFGIAVAMDDGLEIPIGVHYVNNLFSFLFVGYKGSVFEGTPTILLKESEELTMVSVFSNLVVMVVVLLIFKKIFHWPRFSYLFSKIGSSFGSNQINKEL